MWPTFVDASVFDTRRPREDDRRGQDRGHQEDVEERRLGGWHRASRRRVRAHGAQVQGHGGPVAGAAQKDGGRERAARALCRHHRQVARRRRQVLEEAAPHGRARVRASEGRGGLRRVVLDCAEVREEAPRGDGPRGGPEGRPGLPAAGLARRRVPGRLRPGGLRGEGRAHARPLPHGELPAPRRGPHAGLLGRGRRVRARGARGRLRVRGRRARARCSTTRRRSAGGCAGRCAPASSSGCSPPTAGSTTPSPTPTRATRRATSRTRSAATGATPSSRSRASTTSGPSTGACSRTAWT